MSYKFSSFPKTIRHIPKKKLDFLLVQYFQYWPPMLKYFLKGQWLKTRAIDSCLAHSKIDSKKGENNNFDQEINCKDRCDIV